MKQMNLFSALRIFRTLFALSLAMALPAFAGTGLSYDEARVVTNYAEFKAAMEDIDISFVKVGDINEEILRAGETELLPGATVKGGKTLILAGNATFWAPISSPGKGNIDCLLLVVTGSSLNVSGAGTLTFEASLNNGSNAVIRMDGGTVNILSDDVTLAGELNTAVYGKAIHFNYGNLTINGGTFTGKTAMKNDHLFGAVTITGNQAGSIKINGGAFSASAKQGDNKTAGLLIDEAVVATLQITKGNFLISKDSDYSIAVTKFTRLSTSKNVSAFITAPYETFAYPNGVDFVSANTAGIKQSVLVNNSIIETVALTVAVPVAGQTPQAATSTTIGAKVLSTIWKHGDVKMEPTDVFEVGEEYQLDVIVYPADGYVFLLDPAPSVTLNGVARSIYNIGTDFVTILHTFTATEQTVRLIKNRAFLPNQTALNNASRPSFDILGRKMSSDNLSIPGLYVKKVPNSTISH